MKIRFLLISAIIFCSISGIWSASHAEPVHAIAMHGEPALPPDFKHFPYVNPNAPKGGKVVYGVLGTFDSVNPFILKSMRTNARGSWDHQFGHLVFESLLFRSRDEPFTMYGLLAEKVEWPDDRSWIEFTLNPKAKWSDGVPVTVEDVIFTYELLTEKGRPPYNARMKRIDRIEKTGERKVKFVFNEEADREFPLIIALSPILPKHAIDFDTFDQSSLEPMIGSGPYLMDEINPGKFITYKRNPDYWAKDLPSRIGFSNFDEVKVEYYRSTTTHFEAFKKGLFDVFPENDPAAWRRDFNFPAVQAGEVIKDEFEPDTPAKMLGFVFNTRREIFAESKTREALSLLFDFEWTNKNLFFNAYNRTVSFWHGSELSSYKVPASDREKEMLKPFMDRIKPSVLNGTYSPPVSDGSGRDRKILRKAFMLLKEAGYTRDGSGLVSKDGVPFSFEILTRSERQQKLAISYRRILEKLGITVEVRTVDDAQYQRRVQQYDYDMVLQTYTASLSPGIEQIWRWGTRSTDVPGTFNFAGANDPAIDALIDEMLKARGRNEFIDAVRAYDRLLISGDYLVPLFHIDQQWIARRSYIKRPDKTALYGYRLETWWDGRVEQEATQ
ncbi:MAG: extracellular solute-binding protein [Pseudomonadota bacterium]